MSRKAFDHIIFACLLLAAFLCSCKSAQQILPSTHDHTGDSTHIEYKHDSVYIDRWHTVYQKGDTVIIRDSVFRDRWHYNNIHDSIYISNTDTIVQTVTIEKQGSAFLRNSGIALWVLIGLLVIAVIIGIVLKFAK